MLETIATLLVALAGIYAVVGILVGLAFVFRGVTRIDSAATGATWGFRVLILPGVAALWPVAVSKWLAATRSNQ